MHRRITLSASAGLILVLGAGCSSASPSPSASTEPTPRPTSVYVPSARPAEACPDAFGATWTSYASSQYGFIVMCHPDDWSIDPAVRAWDLGADARSWFSPAMDDFIAPTGDSRVSVWAVPFDPSRETTEDVEAWITEYCQETGMPVCSDILDQSVPLCIEVRDCHPGVLVGSPMHVVQAFFTGGIYHGQLVVVSLWETETYPAFEQFGGGRRLIEAFLSTMCVWPKDARPAAPGSC